jgi:hypothetical protein
LVLEECQLASGDIPVERDKLHMLGDVIFEAQLLLKAKYVESLPGNLQSFKEFLIKHNKGTYLLTGNVENGRISVLVENGKVSSILFVESYTGERIVGEKSLDILLNIFSQPNTTLRVFEVREEKEAVEVQKEKTEQPAPSVKSAEKPQATTFPSKTIELDPEKLQRFKQEFRQIANETAEAYGCRIVDLVYEIVGDDLTILIALKKKGIFGKCLEKEFAETIKNDLPLLRENYDLKLNIILKTSLEE